MTNTTDLRLVLAPVASWKDDDSTDDTDEAADTMQEGDKDAYIEKLKKENGKWRVRYRQLQKEMASGSDDAGGAHDDETDEAGDGAEGGSADGQAAAEAAQQADKHRQHASEALARAEAAESALHTARIRLAFIEANLERAEPFKDVDLAMSTVDLGAVATNDKGEVVGLVEAMDNLAKRYPYLVDDSEPTPDPDPSELASGRSTHRKKQQFTDEQSLFNRFPAMRKR